MTKIYKFSSNSAGAVAHIDLFATEFNLTYALNGCIVRVDDGQEFEMQVGMTYRNYVNDVIVPFKRLSFRSKSGASAEGEIIASLVPIVDNRGWPVLSGRLGISSTIIDQSDYSEYLSYENFSGQRLELRAHHANAHEIYLSTLATGNAADAQGTTWATLVPGEAPIILHPRQNIYLAKGASLGYGSNGNPILTLITHY